MSEIKIEKNFKLNDYSIKLDFYGTEKSNKINLEEITNILEEYFKNKNDSFTMIELVSLVRKACRELNETYLMINITNHEDFYEIVLYDNTNLVIYNTEQKVKNINEINNIEINYTAKSGINIFVEKAPNISLNTKEWLNIVKRITDEKTDYLRRLSELKKISPTLDAKIITIVYRWFYQQNPNFNKADDRIKTQLMIAFLKFFDISLDGIYHFTLNQKRNIVQSSYLTQVMINTAPYGEIKETFNDIRFDEQTKRKVEIIGTELVKEMNQQQNQIVWFKELVNTIYIKNYCVKRNAPSIEIARYSQRTKRLVEANLNHYQKIKTNYHKRLYYK